MFKYKYYLYKKTFAKILKEPISLRGGIFSIISTFVAFYFGDDTLGEVAKILQAMLISLIDIPIWLLLVAIYTPFKMGAFGKLAGGKFIYHLPEYIHTISFEPHDNGKKIRFSVKQAPPESLATFKVVYQDGTGFIKLSNHEKSIFAADRETQYSVRLNKKSEAVMEICIPVESRQTIATIYIVCFEKDDATFLKIQNFQGYDMHIKKH